MVNKTTIKKCFGGEIENRKNSKVTFAKIRNYQISAGPCRVPAGIFRGSAMPAKRWYDFFIGYINQVSNLRID